MHKKNVIFILIIFAIALVRADIISTNAGSVNNEVIITPGGDIEGFFSGEVQTICTPLTCAGLGYNCGSWSDGCGDTLNCGSCSSNYTCETGVCTLTTCTPLTCAGLGYNCGSWSDGCGDTLNCGSCSSNYTCDAGICSSTTTTPISPSSGITPSVPTSLNITVTPSVINLTMINGTYNQEVISITNEGSSDQTLSITKTDPNNIISFGANSITVRAGQTENLSINVLSPVVPGLYVGELFIGGNEVLINVNSRERFLLFDSNIEVLNMNYQVSQGGQLETRVQLIPMGDKTRMDVTLNYVIKDYTGKIYLTQSETVLVQNSMDFMRNFGTGDLPLGKYIIGLELVYPGGIAPSSAYFEVLQRSPEDTLGYILFFLVIGILVVIILIIAFLIRVKRGRRIIKIMGKPIRTI